MGRGALPPSPYLLPACRFAIRARSSILDHMTKLEHRLAIGFTRETYEGLAEIARLEESSIGAVVRDCVRAMLPQFLGVTRMIHDPRNTPEEMLEFSDRMQSALDLVSGLGGVAFGDGSGPPDLPPSQPRKPPVSNRGVKS